MRPVLAVGGTGIDKIVDNQDGAVGSIVRKHAQLITHHVVLPNDIGVPGTDLGGGRRPRGRFARVEQDVGDDVFSFVLERTVVPVGHAVHIEAHDFTTAGHNVNAVPFDGGRRKQSQILPVVHLARPQFWNDQLPEQLAGLLVQTHENASISRMFGIARRIVVGADKDLAPGDGHVAIALGAEFGRPFHVFGGG